MVASQNCCSNVFSADRMRRSRRSGDGGSMCSARQRLVISACDMVALLVLGQDMLHQPIAKASASSTVASRKPRNSRICAGGIRVRPGHAKSFQAACATPACLCEIFDHGWRALPGAAGGSGLPAGKT